VSDNVNVVSSAFEEEKIASLSVLGIWYSCLFYHFVLLLHFRVQLKAHTTELILDILVLLNFLI
jgi:hypothetical protein